MRKMATTLLLLSCILSTAFAASFPVKPPLVHPANSLPAKVFIQLKPADIERLSGKKLSWLDKLKLKVLQKSLKRGWVRQQELTEKQEKQARWAMILGLISIPLLFVAYGAILALPAAVLALVLGIKSIKGNSNTKGIIGIVAGSLTLLLTLLALAVIAAWAGGWN